jgi:hypothetical protein
MKRKNLYDYETKLITSASNLNRTVANTVNITIVNDASKVIKEG